MSRLPTVIERSCETGPALGEPSRRVVAIKLPQLGGSKKGQARDPSEHVEALGRDEIRFGLWGTNDKLRETEVLECRPTQSL